jgi:hypothetical protein
MAHGGEYVLSREMIANGATAAGMARPVAAGQSSSVRIVLDTRGAEQAGGFDAFLAGWFLKMVRTGMINLRVDDSGQVRV